MSQGQYSSLVWVRVVGIRNAIADRITLYLQIVMLPGQPHLSVAFIHFPFLSSIKSPEDLIPEIPQLNLDGVLPAVFPR